MPREKRKHAAPPRPRLARQPVAAVLGTVEAVHLRADDKGRPTLVAVEVLTDTKYRFHALTTLTASDGLIGRRVTVYVEIEQTARDDGQGGT